MLALLDRDWRKTTGLCCYAALLLLRKVRQQTSTSAEHSIIQGWPSRPNSEIFRDEIQIIQIILYTTSSLSRPTSVEQWLNVKQLYCATPDENNAMLQWVCFETLQWKYTASTERCLRWIGQVWTLAIRTVILPELVSFDMRCLLLSLPIISSAFSSL